MDDTIRWLLQDADPSLEYQVRRDILHQSAGELEALRRKISAHGWAKALLDERKSSGHWGNGVYNPKWTCTHYVLYELTQLEVPGDLGPCRESAKLLLASPRGADGGVNYAKTIDYSDVCVNGMILTIVSCFGIGGDAAKEIVDYLLKVRMADGGWNCEYRNDARHSSLHTTVSVIEGLETYRGLRGEYRKGEIEQALGEAIEFILLHRLYKSERTGEVIKDEFFKFPFPIRWKYDILRCLDLFRKFDIPRDARMDGALDFIAGAAGKAGRWKAASQPGKTYFAMEKNGSASKWNTLRALRVLARYASPAQMEKKQ
ncbi:MAG TPA: hypothetical protein VN437_00605 [Rectinemataceae bacterium]|nr:hypothetical protein [Rectinemataceae bacterium]